MLLATYLAAALVFGLSLLVGRAIMAASGREEWNGIEPAVGFAGLMAAQGLLARVPGTRPALLLGLAALLTVSVFWLRRPAARRLPGSPGLWAAVLVTALLTAVPFVVSGRWGLLGMGYNNDLGLHLAWAQSLVSDFGTEPSAGYPLGPHGLVASLTALPRLGLGPAFIGLLVALPALTAMTAWSALGKLTPGRRALATVLVAMTYLMASYFAQAALKEVATAMFLLAFTVLLPSMSPLPGSRRERLLLTAPMLVLLAGIVFTYSFPGLAFAAVVAAAWLLSDPSFRRSLRSANPAALLKRPLVAAVSATVLLLLLTLAFIGPFGFGDAFSEVAASDAFGPVSAVEAVGVWLTSDYRLDGDLSTPLPGLMSAIAIVALLLSLWWWYRQPRSVYPIALAACGVFYLLSLPWVGDYSLAKALVISSPIVMVVVLTALLSGPPAEPTGRAGSGTAQRAVAVGWTSFAVGFVLLASASSLIVLRDASVPPPGRAGQLVAFQKEVAGSKVLYADQDRFGPYYFPGADVSLPLKDFPEPDVTADRRKPFEGRSGQSAIDFDSFDAETLNNHDYVVTTSAAWSSKPPPEFDLVGETNAYRLWRRNGEVSDRPILGEAPMPAKLVDCDQEGSRYFKRLDGQAVLMPEAVVGLATEWMPAGELAPGESASLTLNLGAGMWRLSMQYFTPDGMTLRAPGYERRLAPAIDGQRISNQATGSFGQFWSAGLLEVKRAGPVEIRAETDEPSFIQRVTGYTRKTKLGRIAAMRTGARERTSMSEICDRWVDFFRRNSPEVENGSD
jgi:hypothetical protein